MYRNCMAAWPCWSTLEMLSVLWLLSLPVIGQFVFIVTDFMGQVGGYLRQYSPQFIADNNLSRGTSIARHFLSFYSFYQTPSTTDDLDSSRVFKHIIFIDNEVERWKVWY